MKSLVRDRHSVIFRNDFCDWRSGELVSPVETQNYIIVQVAECFYNTAFAIHSHPQLCDLELTFPITGGLFCTADGVREAVRKYEVYSSFRGEAHALSGRNSCRFQTLAVNFKEGPCSPLLEELRARAEAGRVLAPTDAARFFTAIVGEFLGSDALFAHNLDCSITALLVALLRAGGAPAGGEALTPRAALPDIINYIDAHFLDICSLEELSRFGYTYPHLSKLFKTTYGITPSEHLLARRMEHACALLTAGKTLGEIAECLGYSSSYNLSRAFKRHFGLSPNEYKRLQ